MCWILSEWGWWSHSLATVLCRHQYNRAIYDLCCFLLIHHTDTKTHQLACTNHTHVHTMRIIESALFLPSGWPPCFIVRLWNVILFPPVDYYAAAMQRRTRKCSFPLSWFFFFSVLALKGNSLKSMSSFLSVQNNVLWLRESWVCWMRSQRSQHTEAAPVKAINTQFEGKETQTF